MRLSERNLGFNIPALMGAAARSVGRNTADVQSFRKLAEGGFNRIFELTMRDGVQVIARLPTIPFDSTEAPRYRKRGHYNGSCSESRNSSA